MTTESNSRVLICMDCKEEFVFTANAQAYFEHKGLKYLPKRCKFCHIESKKQQRVSAADPEISDLGLRAG